MAPSIILFVTVALSTLPYLAVVPMHVLAVRGIWANQNPDAAGGSWWAPIFVGPTISILYPVTRFSSTSSTADAVLILLASGIGIVLLAWLIVGVAEVGSPDEGTKPFPWKFPFTQRPYWSRVILWYSTGIIVLEAIAAVSLTVFSLKLV